MRRRIIIDTDPGIDDAVAILLALAAPGELEIIGIVAVAGNLPLPQTERNARRVCELAGRTDIPVYAGCARPLLRPLATAQHIHGETARDRLLLPEPTMGLRAQHGVDFLVETLRAAEAGTITLCALGPLTNIAMALVKAPEVAGRIAELVIMGGACFELGNVTPAAEFNIHVDPHAAAIVIESGVPITMMPLDVTHQLLTTPPRLNALRTLAFNPVRARLAAPPRAWPWSSVRAHLAGRDDALVEVGPALERAPRLEVGEARRERRRVSDPFDPKNPPSLVVADCSRCNSFRN